MFTLKNKFYFKFLILFVSQIIFYASNLVTTRLLLKYYGVDFLGEVSYFFVSVSIINTVLNFGLPLYGQLTINSAKHDEPRIINLFKTFLQIRLLLLAVIILVIFVLSYQGVLKNNVFVFLILYSFVYTFYIDWYIIGKENYAVLATSIILGKGIQLLALFFFINLFSNSISVYLLEIVSAFIIAACSMILSKQLFRLKEVFTSIDKIEFKFHFLKLSNSFLSFFSVAIYTTINSWLLSFSVTNREFGYFSIADKYFLLINGVSAIFFRVLFLNNSKNYQSKSLSLSGFFLLVLIPFLSSILAYFFQEIICLLLFGYYDKNISGLINLFIIAYFFNQICLVLSNLLVINQKDHTMQNAFLLSAGIIILMFMSFQFLNIHFASTQSIILTIFGNILSSLFLFYSLYKVLIWNSLSRLLKSI